MPSGGGLGFGAVPSRIFQVCAEDELHVASWKLTVNSRK